MSMADVVFKEICEDIINNGTSTEGQLVRPVWPDTGEKAYTIKQFGVCHTYDLRKEFPAITFRKTFIKSAFDELLWIYQKKSNNIHDLGSHIWDEWADENGSIGKAYGYQIAQLNKHHIFKAGDKTVTCGEYPSAILVNSGPIEGANMDPKDVTTLQVTNDMAVPCLMEVHMDQMDALLYELKHTPFSRRLKLSLWNPHDLADMRLQPCCYDSTFNVTDEGGDKLVLNLVMVQRSQDMLAANNWNTVQYSLLLMAVAQCADMIPGKFVHFITDAHIYDRHIPIVKELIKRKMYPAPIVTLDPDIKDFYQFTKDSVKIENYKAGEQIPNIPIAV